MKVEELTKKICDKYPNVFEKMEDKFLQIPYSMVVKSVCYCDLEDFFKENGIIINVILCKSNQGYLSGRYELFDTKLTMLYNLTIVKGSKQEAKEQAILKASELLEEKLNDMPKL
jgi:hypothetical protein